MKTLRSFLCKYIAILYTSTNIVSSSLIVIIIIISIQHTPPNISTLFTMVITNGIGWGANKISMIESEMIDAVNRWMIKRRFPSDVCTCLPIQSMINRILLDFNLFRKHPKIRSGIKGKGNKIRIDFKVLEGKTFDEILRCRLTAEKSF